VDFGYHFLGFDLVEMLFVLFGVFADGLFHGAFGVGDDGVAFGGIELAFMLFLAAGEVIKADISAEGLGGSFGRSFGKPVEQIRIS
jgi:hypothetical protein